MDLVHHRLLQITITNYPKTLCVRDRNGACPQDTNTVILLSVAWHVKLLSTFYYFYREMIDEVHDINPCNPNWIPQRGVRDSERWKCIMAERVFFFSVVSLYVRVKIHVATFDTNHSVTDNIHSIAVTIQKLPDFFSIVSQCQCVRWNSQVIDQFEVSH